MVMMATEMLKKAMTNNFNNFMQRSTTTKKEATVERDNSRKYDARLDKNRSFVICTMENANATSN